MYILINTVVLLDVHQCIPQEVIPVGGDPTAFVIVSLHPLLSSSLFLTLTAPADCR